MSYYRLNNLEIAGLSTAIPNHSNDLKNSGTAHKVSLDKQTTSDLGFEAASQILKKTSVDVSEIGLLIFLSRTPDYRSPATAMVLQHRLGVGIDTFAYDINSGGLGMFHGIQTAGSILKSLNTNYALIIFGDTPNKQIKNIDSFPEHYTDAASAMLLKKTDKNLVTSIEIISDSSKFDVEINVGGGFRFYDIYSEDRSKMSDKDYLKLDIEKKGEYFNMCQKHNLNSFLEKTGIDLSEMRYYIPGFSPTKQSGPPGANLNIKTIAGHSYGQTVACDIPLQLAENYSSSDGYIIADGAGEGLSYGIMALHISKNVIFKTIETDNYFSNAEVSHNI